MNSISFPFSFNDRQLEEIQYRYALLEPLLDDYLSRQEKREYAEAIRQSLRISERTLRRYLQRFREEGAGALIRKKRSDAGQLRVFSEPMLKRAQELLKQNPRRSLPMLMELLSADAQFGERVKTISPSTLYFHLKKTGHEFEAGMCSRPRGCIGALKPNIPISCGRATRATASRCLTPTNPASTR